MIDESCFLVNECNHCDCGKFCMRRYKLEHLYDNALITETQRKHIPLLLDDDNRDLEAFKKLAEFEKNIVSFVNEGKNLFIHSTQCGNGKAQPDESLVYTDKGYTMIKDVNVCDKLYGEDGNLHSIIGKYDRGVKSVYRVSFSDGTSTECCNEHLWTVKDRSTGKYKTVELNELLTKRLKPNSGYRFAIPMTKSLNFEHKSVLISPYIMGCLLGDGCFRNCLSITNVDDDILNSIVKELPDNIELHKVSDSISYNFIDTECSFSAVPGKNSFKQELKRLNLFNTTSESKFIPDEYMFNDYDSRVALLQGLFDTDGYNHYTNKLILYSTSSKTLADNIKFVVQSLGGTCKIKEKRTNYMYKGEKREGKLSYCLSCKFDTGFIPFRCNRKLERFLNGTQEFGPHRSIVSIDYVGEKHCYCIMTDNPTHLYLTNDLIVTHNTSWTLRLVQAYFNKIWIKSSTDKCRALFINVPRFLLALKDNISEKSDYIRHIKENVLDADIVVWDEVGTKDLTTFEHENVLNLINARLDAGKSNIYTSNASLIAGQGQTSELQTSVGDRLFSRITQLSYCIALNGKDKRFLNVKDKDKIDI